MTAYAALVALHVIAAVLGAGLVFAVLLVAHGKADPASVPALVARIQRLLRSASVALAVLLVTGILATLVAGGAFWSMTWLRLSMGLLVVLGAGLGITRRLVARAADPLALAARSAWVLSAIVAAITYLMAAKP